MPTRKPTKTVSREEFAKVCRERDLFALFFYDTTNAPNPRFGATRETKVDGVTVRWYRPSAPDEGYIVVSSADEPRPWLMGIMEFRALTDGRDPGEALRPVKTAVERMRFLGR